MQSHTENGRIVQPRDIPEICLVFGLKCHAPHTNIGAVGETFVGRPVRNIILFVVLFAAWLLMSGHYTPLLIGLGIASCALATWLADRIGGTDEEGLPLHIMARLPAYLGWLIKEIVMSNIATGRLILVGRARPVLFTAPATQESAGGLVTYANSITLTPGTVTIEVEDADGDNPRFLVHALDASFAADVESGEMDRRVTALESGGGA